MLRRLRASLGSRLRGPIWARPGHYYSPLLGLDDIARRRDPAKPTPEVAIDEMRLWASLEALAPVCRPLDLRAVGRWLPNDMYTAGDAAVLYGMVRTHRPARIMEVGSGYSTAVMVAASEGLSTEVVTIDRDPSRLRQLGLLDEPRLEVITKSVQDVPLHRFDRLQSGDVLFLDTSHVAKTGSDVLWDFFEILPRLAPGVLIHIHDAFSGFEYPVEWMEEGRAWNELYLLRAFLAYNSRFQIVMWPAHSWRADRARAERSVPQLAEDPGGQVWLQVQP